MNMFIRNHYSLIDLLVKVMYIPQEMG